MSDLRIGLISEGITDRIVIEAALRAMLSGRSFILTQLQPETSAPFGNAGTYGGGWGGVYRWCGQVVSMTGKVANNPTLRGYDLIIVHVDADVAGMNYADANIKNGRSDLPCEKKCPPAVDTVDVLRNVVAGWLGLPPNTSNLPKGWAFCTPSKCSESWVVTAMRIKTEPLFLEKIECEPALEDWLSRRPKREGSRLIKSGKKIVPAYREKATYITAQWANIKTHCTQAGRFESEVMAILPSA